MIEPLTRADEGEHAVFTREQLRVSGTPSCGLTLGTSYDGDQGPKLANLFMSKSWVSAVIPAGGLSSIEMLGGSEPAGLLDDH